MTWAVVTGVTSGIGRALTERLLADGWQVAGIGRDRAALAALEGQRFRPVCVDLASPAARAVAFATLAEELPAVHALVNNAAEIVYEAPLAEPPEKLNALFEVNLMAAVELVQALAPRLAAGGTVVNLSSVVARHLPAARYAPYAASKAALEQISHGMRLELLPRGVRVALIAPGLVDTPAYAKVPSFARAEAALRAAVPRWLSADDVAEAVAWILARPAHVNVADLVLVPTGQGR